jgi:hypothetical protein
MVSLNNGSIMRRVIIETAGVALSATVGFGFAAVLNEGIVDPSIANDEAKACAHVLTEATPMVKKVMDVCVSYEEYFDRTIYEQTHIDASFSSSVVPAKKSNVVTEYKLPKASNFSHEFILSDATITKMKVDQKNTLQTREWTGAELFAFIGLLSVAVGRNESKRVKRRAERAKVIESVLGPKPDNLSIK